MRPARLASVLEVLYLVFNEGYSAMARDDWMRPALCTEALRLGRVLAELMPAEPEVHTLVALMEIQASRILARLRPAGLPVPLPEQNRGRWDQLLSGGVDRAVAVAMADGPGRGLEIVDGLAAEPTLASYHYLPSVRGDLLARLGRYDEAAGEFRRAAALTRNTPERTVLLQRAAECDAAH